MPLGPFDSPLPPGQYESFKRRARPPTTMTTIYIDESGHSGDMANCGMGYDFKGVKSSEAANVADLRNPMKSMV